MSEDPNCRYHHLYPVYGHRYPGDDRWYHCVGSAMTTSTTKASTTTTAKTTAKTTTEKPNDGLGDEVILIAVVDNRVRPYLQAREDASEY
ncbi:unnamed protein product, partial [Mesorhabditis spiculigera]